MNATPNHVLIAYRFAAREPSSRRLVMTMSISIIVYAIATDALNLIHHAIMWRAIINASVFGGASAWYFYFKPNVAAYFRELRDRIPVVNSQKYSESIESERNKRAGETALDFAQRGSYKGRTATRDEVGQVLPSRACRAKIEFI